MNTRYCPCGHRPTVHDYSERGVPSCREAGCLGGCSINEAAVVTLSAPPARARNTGRLDYKVSLISSTERPDGMTASFNRMDDAMGYATRLRRWVADHEICVLRLDI